MRSTSLSVPPPPSLQDRPLIVQFCGNDPQTMLAAAKLVEDRCDGVDINLGCPQNIAKRGRYGSWLLEEQDVVLEIVRTMSQGLNIPLTVKMRILLSDREGTFEYAQRIVKAGACAITLHGRTRDQKHHLTGEADWEMIKRMKESLGVPVIANGGISSPEDVERCLKVCAVSSWSSSEELCVCVIMCVCVLW